MGKDVLNLLGAPRVGPVGLCWTLAASHVILLVHDKLVVPGAFQWSLSLFDGSVWVGIISGRSTIKDKLLTSCGM